MKKDNYYLEPLIDRFKNPKFHSELRLFEIDNKTNEINKNFTDSFFEIWKETVDNWSKYNPGSELIESGKVNSDILSIFHLIDSYKATKKVHDSHENKEFYKNYLVENKDLYEVMNLPGLSGYMQIILPFDCEDLSKGKIVTINSDIYPFIYPVGESLVTFYDFFEDIKSQWKTYFPNAIKVIIRKNSLKRFYGITDINPDGGYYNSYDMSHSIFSDCSIRYFYLMPDGNLVGRK
jgi:hypothetical protein